MKTIIEYVPKITEKLEKGGILHENLDLYKQKIVGCMNNEEGIEILSRIGREHKSPEEFFEEMNSTDKETFDFKVLRNFLISYNEGKILNENIHINLQPFTLSNVFFIHKLNNLLFEYNFTDFEKISFEIIENGIITNINILNNNINSLRDMGFKVGLDDYPNQNNNNELLFNIQNLDFVKIDKKFTMKLENSSKEGIRDIIQQMVIEIKKVHENASIIIEGIENLNCYNFIKENVYGIDFMQGYFFDKPSKI